MADELIRGGNQTVEQMQMQLSALPRNRMYPKEEDGTKSKETLSELCRAGLEAMESCFPESTGEQRINRADLSDPKQIRDVCVRYLSACERLGLAPTFAGLCNYLGYSRKQVYLVMRSKQNKGVEMLSYCQSVFASIIEQGGLSRALEAANAIFALKNSLQGYSDRIDILATSEKVDPYESGDPEEIARRYLAGMAEPVTNNNDYLEV